MIETTIQPSAEASIYAGAFSVTTGAFIGISDAGMKFSAHLSLDQARKLVAKLQGAIAEAEAVAQAKAALRGEAA